MEVKPGYKQTEVGVIPEAWEVLRLFELVRQGPRNGYSGRSSDESRGTLTLSLAATSSGRLILNDATVKRLQQLIPAESPLFLESFDVLIQRSNTIDLVGTTAMFDGPPAVYVYPDLMMRLRFRSTVTGMWFWRFANSSRGRSFFRSVAAGSTGTMPKISGERLREMPVPVPPLVEQDVIVEALSDADALIESLEQLLTKKRQLKQGAMQELLTGKKRLPGFSGEWEVRRLGDVADTDSENLGSATRPDFAFNYIALENVDMGALSSYSEHVFRTAPSRARRLLRKDDVLVSTVRPSLMSHLLFTADGGKWVCSTGFCVVRCKEAVSHPGYVYLHMFGGCIARQIEALLTGSNYPAINGGDVRALLIPFPEYEEQIAIATVLSDMDAEIAALEAKLAKARQIKQGMMQELLTGRIRLV